ncbi:MAG: HEAT repeat domain-containing protein [Gemmatimonadales bacterium]
MPSSLSDLLASAAAEFPAALPTLLLLLKATGLLLAALGASLVLQRASAGSRHVVWLVVLVALLVLPALAAWGPLPVRVLPAAPAAVRVAAEPRAAQDVAPSAEQPLPAGADGPSHSGVVAGRPYTLGMTLFGAWALVALALAGRLVYGAWSVRRIVRRAEPLDDLAWQTPLYEIADRLGLDAAPRLLRSEDVKMPFAAGLLASTIVLPAESDGWSAERRSAVLVHELGHIRRHDLIGHTLGRIASALYWFHPLVWTAARRLRAESERACDDIALVFGARPSDYAEHLLDIVTCVRDHATPSVALAMAQRKEFEGRMLAILNPELRRRGPSRLQVVSLAGGLALLTLVVGAASPVPRAAAPRGSAMARDSNPTDDRAAVLARTLRTDSSAAVRRVAAWGLSSYATTEVGLPALIGALGRDADASVREMSAWALAEAQSGSAATAALAKAVRTDRDPAVHATAVWALGELGDETAVETLVGVLSDSDPAVREVAAWSIGGCRPERAPGALIAALSDRDLRVRRSAAWALYTIEDASAASAIEAAFQREHDAELRRDLVKALGAMGDGSVDALQRLVGSADPEIRREAVTALAGGRASGPWPWPRPEPRPFP